MRVGGRSQARTDTFQALVTIRVSSVGKGGVAAELELGEGDQCVGAGEPEGHSGGFL